MLRTPVLLAILVLALSLLACGITINVPVDQIKTGPTQAEEIQIPMPEGDEINLKLGFGAGELKIKPGSSEDLVSGQARYNVEKLKPKITTNGSEISLDSGELHLDGLPNIQGEIENEWDLELGNAPMHLVINGGAYQGRIDLGGLSLLSLEVNDGASNVNLEFSEPNAVEMDTLKYSTGASNVELSGLANANFKSMVFRAGAGDYLLDFSGELQRDATVTVEAGISSVVINVPKGMAARLVFTSGLSNVDLSGGWEQDGKTYILTGSGPLLTITVDMGAGNLELTTQ